MNRRELLKLAAALPVTPLMFSDEVAWDSHGSSMGLAPNNPLKTDGVAVRAKNRRTGKVVDFHAPPGSVIFVSRYGRISCTNDGLYGELPGGEHNLLDITIKHGGIELDHYPSIETLTWT